MPPRADKQAGTTVQSLTASEADAAIMRDCGLSYEEVAGLNLYWKRLLLGYREPKPDKQADLDKFVRQFTGPLQSTQQAPGGWRVPGRR